QTGSRRRAGVAGIAQARPRIRRAGRRRRDDLARPLATVADARVERAAHRALPTIGHLERARCPVVPPLLGVVSAEPQVRRSPPPDARIRSRSRAVALIRDAEPAGLESEQLLVTVRGRSTGLLRIDGRTDVEVRRARVHDRDEVGGDVLAGTRAIWTERLVRGVDAE